MEPTRVYTVLGGMSGTSLDGLDLALCRFEHHPHRPVSWRYTLLAAQTRRFTAQWHHELSTAHALSAVELTALDRRFGRFLGAAAVDFVRTRGFAPPDLYVSHGQTIFHAPHQGFTLQIGAVPEVSAAAGCAVLGDLRSGDVALGGQGAPLVPIGDRMLFGEYTACVNLGGFANLSLEQNGRRVAWDVCAANGVLNLLARRADERLDCERDGELAQNGRIIPTLLDQLEALPFYLKSGPRSLGREFTEAEVLPLLDAVHTPHDLLRTYTEHIALRLCADLNRHGGKVLFTGGGTHNAFLLERIRAHARFEVIKPDDKLIDFKEAIVFAFLGALWLNGDNNVLSSVTGAAHDHRSGVFQV